MDEQGDKTGSGRWICCYWQERYEELGRLPRQAGLVSRGVLMLPPPVEDLTIAEGLWTELNEKVGTLFDVAEEEDIPPYRLAAAAQVVSRFVDRIRARGSDLHTAEVGQQITPQSRLLIAEFPASELSARLQMLADFLDEAATRGKLVTISL